MAAQGCSTQKPVPLNPPARASYKGDGAPEDPCADRYDSAQAGGLAGSVVGTVIGTVFGMPYLGLAYKLAGFAIGYTVTDPCSQPKPTVASGEAPAKAAASETPVKPAVAREAVAKPAVRKIQAKPAKRVSAAIKEETL